MTDVDIDQFGEHESRPEDPTDECTSLYLHSRASGPLGTQGRSTWEPEHEQKNIIQGRVSKN